MFLGFNLIGFSHLSSLSIQRLDIGIISVLLGIKHVSLNTLSLGSIGKEKQDLYSHS